MSHEINYYLAHGEAAELVRDYFRRRAIAADAHVAFMRSIGARDGYPGGTFDYDKGVTPPDGILRYARSARNRGRYYMDRKSEAGAALRKRHAALQEVPHIWELCASIDGGIRFGRQYGFRIIGDAVVISAGKDWEMPRDCTPLKASAYWRMVEAEEAE